MGADRITNGPINLAGTNPYDSEAIILDVAADILSFSGNDKTVRAAQCSRQVIQAQTALTNVTTAQTLFTKTLNAGEMNTANRTYSFSGYGIYTSPGTTTPTLTFTLSLAGVTLASITTGAVSSTASANMPFQFEFILGTTATGSNGSVESHGEIQINLTANTPAGQMSYYPDTVITPSTGINLTNADVLLFTVAASSTISSVQLRQAFLEVVA